MELLKAYFLERLNRFVIKVKINKRTELAYLPNPGRLWELLLPGTPLLLTPSFQSKYSYTAIACFKENSPVLLHTHLTNYYIKQLLEEDRLPFFKGYRIIKEEPKIGKRRLDFYLESEEKKLGAYLEVKTCTLFGKELAMFPDAETQRGASHLYNLARLKEEGYRAVCLFALMNPEVKYFLPAYHIDFAFTQTFLETWSKIEFYALALAFSPDLSKIQSFKEVQIPITFLKEEFQNSGSYLLLLQLNQETPLFIGINKNYHLPLGYYVYVGSAKKNLKQRISRYFRKNLKKRWHVDYLLEKARLIKGIPIVSREDLECAIAKALLNISDQCIKNFGSSDCLCTGHLFYFSRNPLQLPSFIKVLNYFHLEKPAEKIKNIKKIK